MKTCLCNQRGIAPRRTMAVPEPKPVAADADGRHAGDGLSRPVTAVNVDAGTRCARRGDWLALVCRMIPDVASAYAGFSDIAADVLAEEVAWPAGERVVPALAAAAQRALEREEGAVDERRDDDTEIIARRLKLGPGRHGAVAVLVPALTDNARTALLQLLDWSAVWLDFVAAGDNGAGDAELTRELVYGGLDAADLRRAATRMAAIVATSLAAERVSIGLCTGDDIQLIALSHSAAFNPRLQLNRDIVAAMEEALDEARAIVYPADPAAPPSATHAHERLCAGDIAVTACSMPLLRDARIIGIITVERSARDAFSAADLERLGECAAALGRVLAVREALERPLVRRLRDSIGETQTWLKAPGDVFRKALLLLGAVAIAVLFFGSGELQVVAPAELEGRIQRSLTAPIDGYIAEAPARAGDALKAGDVIAVIDTRSLEFERRRWQNERAEYEKSHRRAIAELDRAEATIMKARLGRAASQLALIEEQLQRATVVAPFDGMIISGDLSRSMGAPVSRGDVLFEMAPLDDYRVGIEVDERDIAQIEAGQSGSLALTALPGERLEFTVDQITNVAQTSDGRNVFAVEAQLQDGASLLRPGMHGVAKIHAGEDRLIRVWTHGVFDRIRLWLWSRAP